MCVCVCVSFPLGPPTQANDSVTHRWTVYFRSANGEDLSHIISKVGQGARTRVLELVEGRGGEAVRCGCDGAGADAPKAGCMSGVDSVWDQGPGNQVTPQWHM